MKKPLVFQYLVANLSMALVACSTGPRVDQHTAALVNKDVITVDQYQRQVDKLAQTPGTNLQSQDARVDLLREMVSEMLVFQEILEGDYLKSNLELRHDIVKAYLNDKFGPLISQPTETEINDFYEKNKTTLDKVRASHILVGLKKPGADLEKGRALAQDIYKKITSKQISFDEAVKKYSEDTTTLESVGDLGYFSHGQMVPEFAQAAFGLKNIGDISPIVETAYGFHIIKLTGDYRGIDHFYDEIETNLKRQRVNDRVQKYFGTLKADADVKIFDQNIKDVIVRK
ncbi:MAG: peptidylprolyl isomerase [Bdellovibrionota bacterium]